MPKCVRIPSLQQSSANANTYHETIRYPTNAPKRLRRTRNPAEAINTGMEYPDAEYRVASTLYMTDAERQAMADAYLTIDDTEHQLRNYWQ